MERYTVIVVSPLGPSVDLLIPCSSKSTIADLTATALTRANKRLHNLPQIEEAELHLHKTSGPLLDYEDIIEHVIVTPSSESIFITFNSSSIGSHAQVSRPYWHVRSHR